MVWQATVQNRGGSVVDVSAMLQADDFSIMQQAYADVSTCSGTIQDDAGTLDLQPEAELLVTDAGVRTFAGYIRSRKRTDRGTSALRTYRFAAQDYNTLLADDVVDAAGLRTTAETDQARVRWLLQTFGTKGIASITYVQQVRGSNMPSEQDFTGLNLHEGLTLIASATGAGFYVDYSKEAHYFATEVNAAPFNLSDNPNLSTTFGYENLELADDTVALKNAVFVIGTGISGWRTDGASITQYGRREATLVAPEVEDQPTLDATGDAFLQQYAIARSPNTLTTYRPGLRAGMTVQLTHAGWAISAATYRIGNQTIRIVDSARLAYDVVFGSRPVGMADMFGTLGAEVNVARQVAADVAGSLSGIQALDQAGANLVPNSSFEDGTAWAVGANWTIGFAVTDAYQGSKVARAVLAAQTAAATFTAFIGVDRNYDYFFSWVHWIRSWTSGTLTLYIEEYNGAGALLATSTITKAAADAAWVREFLHFGPSALPGRLAFNAATAKIRIGFAVLASATMTVDIDALQVEKSPALTAYAPSPYELLTNSVGTTQIADNAVTSPKIIADAVVAGKIAAAVITAREVAAKAITGDKLSIGGNVGVASNAVVNGSFEDVIPATSLPAGWTTAYESLGAGSTYTRFGASFGINGPAIFAISTSVGDGGSAASRSFPVTVGDKWYFAVQTISDSVTTQGFYFRIYWGQTEDFARGDSGVTYTDIIANGGLAGSGSWVKKQAYLTVPSGAKYCRVALYNYQPNVSGAYYFDEVIAQKLSAGIINSTAEVTIDETGITILNGKLTIQDRFGKTVADASGFTGGWATFIRRGFYNGTFADGSTSDIPATIVGTASTIADYAASLGALLPWWVVSNSTGTLKIVTDAGASDGTALEINNSVIFQDVPILPGLHYGIFVSGKQVSEQGYLDLSWRDANHAIIGSAGTQQGLELGTAAYTAGSGSTRNAGLPPAPPTAAFLRVTLSTGGSTYRVSDVAIFPATTYTEQADLVVATSDLTLSTTLTAIPGTDFTVPAESGGRIEFQCDVDVEVTVGGAGVITVRLQFYDDAGVGSWIDSGYEAHAPGGAVTRQTIPLTARSYVYAATSAAVAPVHGYTAAGTNFTNRYRLAALKTIAAGTATIKAGTTSVPHTRIWWRVTPD